MKFGHVKTLVASSTSQESNVFEINLHSRHDFALWPQERISKDTTHHTWNAPVHKTAGAHRNGRRQSQS